MEKVVFCRINGVEQPGSADAHAYGVWGFPSFVVTDATGEVIDRWVGYDGTKPEDWLGSLTVALADPTPIGAKKARFAAHPDAANASMLGRIAWGGGAYRESVEYYKQAQALEPEHAGEFNSPIFEAVVMGARGKARVFAFAEARDAADAVLHGSPQPREVVHVAYEMQDVARGRDQKRQLAPYLEAALQASADSGDPRLQHAHADLAVEHALVVERDKDKALQLKRASLAEKWEADPEALNGFAWWCFENRINLAEAEALARRGVDLATSDDDKANLLDTAAAISAERGELRQAISLEKRARDLQPANRGFRQQLARFRRETARG